MGGLIQDFNGKNFLAPGAQRRTNEKIALSIYLCFLYLIFVATEAVARPSKLGMATPAIVALKDFEKLISCERQVQFPDSCLPQKFSLEPLSIIKDRFSRIYTVETLAILDSRARGASVTDGAIRLVRYLLPHWAQAATWTRRSILAAKADGNGVADYCPKIAHVGDVTVIVYRNEMADGKLDAELVITKSKSLDRWIYKPAYKDMNCKQLS